MNATRLASSSWDESLAAWSARSGSKESARAIVGDMDADRKAAA